MNRPPLFIHVDLDGLWTLPACYGYPEADAYEHDPVFALALPRLLETLDAQRLKATVFIVGRDLESAAKRAAVRQLAAAGHRLASHGYAHDLALGLRPPAAMLDDLQRTQTALADLTGAPPLGFRAPGYGATPALLAAAAQAGLRYDGSLLPGPWGGLLRAAMRRVQARVRAHAAAPADLHSASAAPPLALVYGGGERGPRPLAPFLAHTPHGALWRLPVAVTPTLRLPLQASLALRLGPGRTLHGLAALARRGAPLTWLLHGMDFLGPEDLVGRLPAPLARAYGPAPAAARLRAIGAVLAGLRAFGTPLLSEDWVLHAAANRPQ